MKIFTIGDSLTAGYPGNDLEGESDSESSYQYWLEKTLREDINLINAKVHNFGVPGINTKEILERFVILSKEKPFVESEIVIINGGGNEWTKYARIDDSNLIKNLIQCCDLALNNKKTVILTSLTPFGDDVVMEQVQEIAGKLEQIAKTRNEKKILFFDWFKIVYDPLTNKLNSDYDSGDGEHLNIKGYKKIGTKLAELIKDNTDFLIEK